VLKGGYSRSDQIMQAIEDRGYRATSPRQRLVLKVAGMDGHFTAEELRKKVPQIGRATVYRSLSLLVDAGILCRVLLEDGSLHYQLSHRGHHHHLICAECGLSQDLLGCDIETVLKEKAAQHQFQPEGHRLEVYGKCHRCASLPSPSG
jgi:Fur family ferric uptake transcriptional regulator